MEVLEVRDSNDKIDLSIIVPCHNLEHYINSLLVSLRLQIILFYNVELIFICDNCTDRTESLIKNFNFGGIYKKIHIENVRVMSAGLARNVGLDMAKGEYIWFIDGDDWLIDIHAIAKVINTLNIKELPVIRFNYEAPNFPAAHIELSMPWQYVYRKDFIGDIRFTKIQPHEDVIFSGKIAKKLGGEIKFIDELLYHYNFLRPGSNMYQYFKNGHVDQ